MRVPHALKLSALVAASVLLPLLLVEACFALVLAQPGLLQTASWLRPPFRHVYMFAYRDVLQADFSRMRYDPELTYVMQPSSQFRFRNSEFDVAFSINRLGFRDDDQSLVAPAAVVVGDSYAQGWGVEAKDTFAQVLEDRLRMPVLNAGIASYGTVRERKLLDRLDRSRLTHLVIQYCDNDVAENLTFHARGGSLPITSEADLRARFAADRARPYFPGRYLLTLIERAWDRTRPPADGPVSDTGGGPSPAQAFLQALVGGGTADLSAVHIIAFELAPQNRNSSNFVSSVAAEIQRGTYPDYIKRMTLLDVSTVLTDSDYFVLDDHLNAAGHRKVADAILRAWK
jgi:hypothetical protein